MNKRQGRSPSRRRTIVTSLIVVLVIAGGFFLLGRADETEAPNSSTLKAYQEKTR